MKFLDTNIVLDYADDLADFAPFVISSVTLQELESIKSNRFKNDDTKLRARKAVKWLTANRDLYDVKVYDGKMATLLQEARLEPTPDNKILACARACGDDVTVITNDLCCRLLAQRVFFLDVDFFSASKPIYKGYRRITGSSDEINNLLMNLDYNQFKTNEYLIIKNTDDGSDKEMRFDGEKFVSLKLPPSKYVKGKDPLQRCALDLLNNPNIPVVAILGNYGSGKSYLAMRMALYSVNEKGWQSSILGVRSPQGEGVECGYLPGSLEDKTDNFFLPLAQQLDGGQFELDSLKQREIIKTNIPFYMKGTTYNSTVMLVDEAEDLDIKQLRLIGTRLGEGSRVFFSGDYKQSVIDTSESNALVQMCNRFQGKPNFGCIYLEEDVRSNASKMFADWANDND